MRIHSGDGLLAPVDVPSQRQDAVHQVVALCDGVKHGGDIAGLLVKGCAGTLNIFLYVAHAFNCGMFYRPWGS